MSDHLTSVLYWQYSTVSSPNRLNDVAFNIALSNCITDGRALINLLVCHKRIDLIREHLNIIPQDLSYHKIKFYDDDDLMCKLYNRGNVLIIEDLETIVNLPKCKNLLKNIKFSHNELKRLFFFKSDESSTYYPFEKVKINNINFQLTESYNKINVNLMFIDHLINYVDIDKTSSEIIFFFLMRFNLVDNFIKVKDKLTLNKKQIIDFDLYQTVDKMFFDFMDDYVIYFNNCNLFKIDLDTIDYIFKNNKYKKLKFDNFKRYWSYDFSSNIRSKDNLKLFYVLDNYLDMKELCFFNYEFLFVWITAKKNITQEDFIRYVYTENPCETSVILYVLYLQKHLITFDNFCYMFDKIYYQTIRHFHLFNYMTILNKLKCFDHFTDIEKSILLQKTSKKDLETFKHMIDKTINGWAFNDTHIICLTFINKKKYMVDSYIMKYLKDKNFIMWDQLYLACLKNKHKSLLNDLMKHHKTKFDMTYINKIKNGFDFNITHDNIYILVKN
jgi:hypothetical protein